MLVEDISSNQINIEEKGKQPKNGNIPLSYTLTSIDELQLMIDKNSKEDLAQLNKILGEILNYPNSEQAKIHSEAMRLGNFDLQKQEGNSNARQDTSSSFMEASEGTKLCPCCGFIKQQDQIKLCTSFDGIKNMGVSTYLYFSTFKNLSILLVILLIIYGIYGIITNVIASANLSSTVSGSYSYTIDYLSISLSSKETHDTPTNRLYYYIQCWLGVVFIIIWGLVLVFIKYSEIKNMQNYDDDTISCSDYSIVMEGVPVDIKKEELQKQLNTYYENVIRQTKIPAKWKKPLNIVKINVGKPFYLNQDSLKDEELENIMKETTQIKEEFVKWIIERQNSPKFSLSKEQRDNLYTKYTKLNERKIEKYEQIAKKIKTSLKEQSSDELTTVFVTFDTNFAKSLMSYLNETTTLSRIRSICGQDSNKFSFQREGKVYKLEIRRAPEPEDIIWTNIGQKNCTTYSRKLFTFSVTVALLGVCFAIVYGLTKAQQDAGDNRQISIAISLTISIVNVLLGQLIRFLTLYQRDYTETHHQTSLAIKSIIAQMVNSILIPVITAYYIKKKIYETSGLVDNIFMLSISTSIVPPILLFFDPYNLFLKFKRWYKSKPSNKLSQTQKQHNILHEGVNFQVGYQYLYLVNLFMFVCFFVSLQPIVVVIALVGYLLMYWVQKYCLFNRYKRPVPGTDFVNQAVHQIIFMGPIIYSLGSLTWSNFSPNGIPREAILPNLVAMGLSVLLYVLPMNTIIIGCFFQDEIQKSTTFDEYRLFLPSEYDRLNPTTQQEGLEDYRKYMERKKEEMKNFSKQKQAEIAQKMMHNAQRGQLNMVRPNPAFGVYPAFQNNYAMMPRPQPMVSFFPFNPQVMPAPMYGMMPYQQMPVSRPVQPMMQPVPQFMPQIPMVSQVPMIYNAQQNPQIRPVNMAQPINNPLAMMMNPQLMGNPSSMNLNNNPMNYNQNMNPKVRGGFQAPYGNRRY